MQIEPSLLIQSSLILGGEGVNIRYSELTFFFGARFFRPFILLFIKSFSISSAPPLPPSSKIVNGFWYLVLHEENFFSQVKGGADKISFALSKNKGRLPIYFQLLCFFYSELPPINCLYTLLYVSSPPRFFFLARALLAEHRPHN